ncbi:type II secretion system protein GspD [bacterium]|nr:type II secretion system protein GspD [bacterium]
MKIFNVSISKFTLIMLSLLMSITFMFAQGNEDLLVKQIENLNFKDTKITSVIETISKLTGVNIIVASEASKGTEEDEKRVTVRINSISVENAISLVAKSVGYSYKVIGANTFLIGPSAIVDKESGTRNYVYQLKYIDSEKIVNAFKDVPGEVIEVSGQNALLIRANPETFADIESQIKKLDMPQKQVQIRVRVIEVNVSDSKKMGIDWSKLNQLTTIIAEDPVNYAGVGLPYNFDDETGASPFGGTTALGTLPGTQYFQKMSDWDDFGKFSKQLYAFDITIDWLLENNSAKILTDTRLTAQNGEEAYVHIGESLPYVVVDNEKEVQVAREDTGIKLNITPKVNSENEITTQIKPEISSVIDLVGGYVPRVKVRTVSSTITVPSGDTFIVSGLLSTQLTTRQNKVPFLGDIPYIGRFFRHETENLEKTDLIIEMTPTVVNASDFNKTIEVADIMTETLIKFDEQE